jgi:predicted MFS family arabinose efflux permease
MRFTGLWRHPDFLRLWSGQAISLVGSHMVFVALPLTAVVVLDASPAEMGIVTALGGLPALAFGVFIGVWVDRHRRRPVMMAADFARAALLISIPIAHWLDALTIGHIFAVAVGLGTFGLLFEVAYLSIMPSLIPRDDLVDANSKLQMARSGAEVVGPGIGGGLAQAVSAPFVMIFGAGAYLASAVFLSTLRIDEGGIGETEQPEGAISSIREGIRFIRQHRVLLGLAVALAMLSGFSAAFEAIEVLYKVRELGLNPASIGAIYAVGGVGLVTGAILASRIYSRVGVGPVMMIGLVMVAGSDLVLPVVGGSKLVVIVALSISSMFFGLGLVMFNIAQTSLRQGLTPQRLQGRMNSTMAVVARGAIPAGALGGGLLAEVVGVREALFVAVAGEAMAVLGLIYGGAWGVRRFGEADDGA